jgi:hypothetical protein
MISAGLIESRFAMSATRVAQIPRCAITEAAASRIWSLRSAVTLGRGTVQAYRATTRCRE